jgi:hypothetical protein
LRKAGPHNQKEDIMSNQETITLKNTVDAYLEHLEKNGTKASTIGVYKRALDLAVAYFGEDKKLTGIMVPHAAKFLESPQVNFHPNGTPKAEPTIKQTKRVFRQCMQFAKDRGFVHLIPVPKAELLHARRKAEKTETSLLDSQDQ